MKVINPIGRKPGNEALAYSIRACMCRDDKHFSDANTTEDRCTHCGCDCGLILANGNYVTARDVYRTSHL